MKVLTKAQSYGMQLELVHGDPPLWYLRTRDPGKLRKRNQLEDLWKQIQVLY